MNQGIKIIVDECVGPRYVAAMRTVLELDSNQPHVISLHEFRNRYGEKDRDWIPAAAKEGYSVISVDHGRKKPGDKLPEICEQYAIKHILISPTIKHAGTLAMALASLGSWRNIVTAHEDSNTLRFKLRLVDVHAKDEVGPHRHALHRQGRKQTPSSPVHDEM